MRTERKDNSTKHLLQVIAFSTLITMGVNVMAFCQVHWQLAKFRKGIEELNHDSDQQQIGPFPW